MGIRTSCANEDGLDLRMVLEVRCKGFSHRLVVLLEREVVFLGRVMDEGRYCREGVGCDDVNSLKSRGEAVGGGGLGGVGVEGCEIEDEQDETVFAAVVAEGKVVEATMIINQSVQTLTLTHTHNPPPPSSYMQRAQRAAELRQNTPISLQCLFNHVQRLPRRALYLSQPRVTLRILAQKGVDPGMDILARIAEVVIHMLLVRRHRGGAIALLHPLR